MAPASEAAAAGEGRHQARDRAIALLRPAYRHGAGESQGGYIDLLGEGPASTGVAQDLMTSGLVPRIYERYWRPALGRVAKGLTGPGMQEEVRIARLLMSLGTGDTVLDVACGPGNFSREFARSVGEDGLVVGIDVSKTMLARGAGELGRSGLGNLALVRGDAVELPFEDQVFDAVCCFAALHLFADPLAALDNMTRVLRPGGRLALFTSVRRQITLPIFKPVIERTSGMRVFEPDEIAGALEQRGFRDIHQRLSGMTQFVGGRLDA
jgi:ubiquinone/menaquinone biosynthesis C-methylase UbiE